MLIEIEIQAANNIFRCRGVVVDTSSTENRMNISTYLHCTYTVVSGQPTIPANLAHSIGAYMEYIQSNVRPVYVICVLHQLASHQKK